MNLLNTLDFADALANPMKYLSEKEKRAKQLESLMDDDEEETAGETDSFPASASSELMLPPTPAELAYKRGSVVSLSGILNTNKDSPLPPKGMSAKGESVQKFI